ncbi:MAG: PQQ-binding-like beta-propeller repeat protein [Alphaproteobacteria bacterium]|nr:PQQ-binding-like beta-propeller repeat protein [Alphaproteobacteria bacterium]
MASGTVSGPAIEKSDAWSFVKRRLGLRGIGVVCALLALSGCDFFEAETTRIPGERISIMLFQNTLEPDPRIADLQVRLPRPVRNIDWPQSGGNADHAMNHLELGAAIQEIWRADIGAGSSDTQRLLAQPIVAGDRIYAMDSESSVSAFNRANGAHVWTIDAKAPDDDDEAFGGGIAFEDGRLFVTTGFAQIFSVDAQSGKELWRKIVSGPMRAPPSVKNGRVFAITIDNQLFAFDAKTGEKLWSHTGISEVAGLLGGASPAVSGGAVIAPYSSGEVYALRVESGRVIWSDNLTSSRRLDALSSLADIRGMPVVDRGLVYAISHSGRMVAIDLRTGGRAWERGLGGVEMPWVAGEYIFVVTNRGELVCMTRRGGRIRWVQSLPRYEDDEEKDEPIKWSGPVLAGDRLVLVGSHGEAWSVSPYTGKPLGRVELGDDVLISPIVADGTIYFLTEAGDLVAMR